MSLIPTANVYHPSREVTLLNILPISVVAWLVNLLAAPASLHLIN